MALKLGKSSSRLLLVVLQLAFLFATVQAQGFRGGWGNRPDSNVDDDGNDGTSGGSTGTDTDNTSSGDGTDAGTAAGGRGSGDGQGQAFIGFDPERANRIREIHGLMACIAFVCMFPLGAVFVRTMPGRWALFVHAGCQVIALLLFIAAAGMGIWMLTEVQPFGISLLDMPDRRAHPILGIVILILIIAMPVLGLMHHSKFKKVQRRTAVSHVHLWLGRGLVILGIVNGGLGLKQSGRPKDFKVAYAIVAAVAGSVWLFFSVYGEMAKRKDARPAAEQQEERKSRDDEAHEHVYGAAMLSRARPRTVSSLGTRRTRSSSRISARSNGLVSISSGERDPRQKNVRHDDSASDITAPAR